MNSVPRPLSVIMTTYNQWALTERCLGSLLKNSRATAQIVVVDNGSTDQTRAELPDWAAKFYQAGIEFVIEHSPENVGFGRGMNRGLEIIKQRGMTPYLAIANNDIYVMPEWDRKLIQALEKYKVDFVSPMAYEQPFTENTHLELFRYAHKNLGRKRKQWSMILGVFTRAVVEEIGLFNPKFFVGYEDFDLKHRFDLAGKKYWMVGDTVIWHKSRGTRGSNLEMEQFGLKTFLEIWGFDPRTPDHTFIGKMKRAFRRWKLKFEYL